MEGVKPPAIKINPEQVRPGGEVCMASPILWLTGIPTSLPDTAITAECSSFGAVLDVLQPTAPPHDEAFVMFADIRHALPSVFPDSACACHSRTITVFISLLISLSCAKLSKSQCVIARHAMQGCSMLL